MLSHKERLCTSTNAQENHTPTTNSKYEHCRSLPKRNNFQVIIVSNITPLPSLLFTRQLAHYLHHQPILLNALNVVLGLVQRTLPVSLLPKIPETLEAIGVLVHTDHHRRSTFRVSFSANAATSKVIFVVLHHLLYRLFQSRDVFSLLVDPLSR